MGLFFFLDDIVEGKTTLPSDICVLTEFHLDLKAFVCSVLKYAQSVTAV